MRTNLKRAGAAAHLERRNACPCVAHLVLRVFLRESLDKNSEISLLGLSSQLVLRLVVRPGIQAGKGLQIGEAQLLGFTFVFRSVWVTCIKLKTVPALALMASVRECCV